MHHGNIVGLTHNERHWIENGLEGGIQFGVSADGLGQESSPAHHIGLVSVEGGRLHPHHAAEITLQPFRTGVMPTGLEQGVGEHHHRIFHKRRKSGARGSAFFHLIVHHFRVLLGYGAILLGVEQSQRDGEIGLAELGKFLILLVDRIGDGSRTLAIPLATEVLQGVEQFTFLSLAQHAVEVHVIELQIEVGSDETGKVVIVVVLVHLEQLVVGVGHDGKTLFRKHVQELRIRILKLETVYQIVNHRFTIDKVLFLQFLFPRFEFGHEGLLLLGELILWHFFPFVASLHFKLPSAHHGIPVPRGLIEYRPQIGHRKSISLTGVECITQYPQLVDAELRDIHIEVYLLVQHLHINLSVTRKNVVLLFTLLAPSHEDEHRQ